ncbi:hypothetical protein O181_091282 [Austropuccinia psidii MF-1]|uniref:Reverse transcriptase Ty1/copia-type domain-containing protein n=1 Tax=Austropuccinia psidii MF-1 TaxID=1389203 RepID=A0A9Q3IX80_9BASI|nr:hypothetical protein [Austropuccinia psidii MF-1]
MEPKLNLQKLLPFGLKTQVMKIINKSKLINRSTTLRALTIERYSDFMKFLNLDTGHIIISQDCSTPSKINPSTVKKTEDSLPCEKENSVSLLRRNSKNEKYIDKELISNDPVTISSSSPIIEPVSQVNNHARTKGWDYVPFYDKEPKDISVDTSTYNILVGSRRRTTDSAMLMNVVPFSQAMNNSEETHHWNEAMKKQYNSLMQHNTGELIPYPKDAQVIGGMWVLNQKGNEYGEVYKYKARWVVLGNHQVHMLHYFETWSSVGRNETLKIILLLIVNVGFVAYQFEVETAFLHGEIDANIYFIQVEDFEIPGKENRVWKLKKSLYGTKQAPCM